MKITTKSFSLVMLSITVVGIAIYNMLIAAPPGRSGGTSIGTGGAGVPRGIPSGIGGRMTPPVGRDMGGAIGGTRRPGFTPATGSPASRIGRIPGTGHPGLRPVGPVRPVEPGRGPRPGVRPDGRPDGRWDGRGGWDGRGRWDHGGWWWRRPFWGTGFGFGFWGDAPWWAYNYPYLWDAPQWKTIDLQQQIFYLQQQIAYLMQQLNSITDSQQQYYLQQQIDEYNQQLSSLTGQSYGYGY